MENENDIAVEVVETENHDEEVDLGSDTEKESENSHQKETPKESPEDKLARLERQAKQLRKKLGIDDKPQSKQDTKSNITSEKTDFDYGEKAFLKSYDIKGSDELSLVKQWIDRTGDSLDTVVEDDIFQAKLTKLREAKAVKNAIPTASKRAPVQAKDQVEYHIEKYNQTGELPKDFETRSKVLQKIVEQKKTPFS